MAECTYGTYSSKPPQVAVQWLHLLLSLLHFNATPCSHSFSLAERCHESVRPCLFTGSSWNCMLRMSQCMSTDAHAHTLHTHTHTTHTHYTHTHTHTTHMHTHTPQTHVQLPILRHWPQPSWSFMPYRTC